MHSSYFLAAWHTNVVFQFVFTLLCTHDMQSAVGYDYQAQLAKHGSQTDAAKGFGGKYGVQKDHKDKVGIFRSTCVCVFVCSYLMTINL